MVQHLQEGLFCALEVSVLAGVCPCLALCPGTSAVPAMAVAGQDSLAEGQEFSLQGCAGLQGLQEQELPEHREGRKYRAKGSKGSLS